MSRAHFETSTATHRKIVAAGNGATGLWFRLVLWCREQLTDGRVPREVLRMFATSDDEIACAIAAGLIDLRDDGEHWVHDYLHHNHTRKQVEKIRKERQKAGSFGGKQKAKTRAKQTPSNLLAGLLEHAPTPSIPDPQYPSIPVSQVREGEAPAVPAPGPSQTKPAKKPKAIASRLPDDWEPPGELVEKLRRELKVDPLPSVRRFRNHFASMADSNRNAKKTRWDLAFENWVEGDAHHGKLPRWVQPIPPPHPEAAPMPRDEAYAAVMAGLSLMADPFARAAGDK